MTHGSSVVATGARSRRLRSKTGVVFTRGAFWSARGRRSALRKDIPVEGPGLEFTEAIIDNGKFGKHVVRFEAGLLAQQADGSAAVYLDGDTMLLSATTAAKTPRDSIDFFPLTVDVEERMYAAGRIPGSFFRMA